MKKYIFSCIAIILISSCKKDNTSSVDYAEYYDLTQAEEGTLADVFSDVELTPLQYGGGDYPKMVDRLILTDNLIIVSDLHKLIHIFDK